MFLRKIEENYKVVWIDKQLYNKEFCHAKIDGTFIYRDKGHLSHEGSAYLGHIMNFYKLITTDYTQNLALLQ
jgi:hypothetical protein